MIFFIIISTLLAIALLVCGFGWFETHRKLEEERLLNLSMKAGVIDQENESEFETGHAVKRKFMKKPRAETYRNVFDFDVNGQRILEDLTERYCKSSYVRGGQDAERESCYRAGQASVINFILVKVNQANDPNYKESEDE